MINGDEYYQNAEVKAEKYFKVLYTLLKNKKYACLIEDLNRWKQNHTYSGLRPFLNRKKKISFENSDAYIKWLQQTGRLDSYLDRSVSYIFLRDLGKTLDSEENLKTIRKTVDRLETFLTSDADEKKQLFSWNHLYRLAEKEGIPSTIIWLFHKLKVVQSLMPEGMDAVHAQRKLMKLIAGVVMHVLAEMKEDLSPEERRKQLDEAIRLGYSYGLTYPFIDDLLDANVLSDEEKKRYSAMIRETLVTEEVPEWTEWTGENKDTIQNIHRELGKAFEYIKEYQQEDTIGTFFKHSYLFFHSQEVDRNKDLSQSDYTNEELYLPVILKSASSRMIVRSLIRAPKDEDFNRRAFYYGLYNQLADDFTDSFTDLEAGAVTPYTYYLKYHKKRTDLINPFEMYWTVIFYLIHDVYNSDPKTSEVIFNRAINGLKRFKAKWGTKKFDQVMKILAPRDPYFKHLIKKLVSKADDVDFFDKLLRDQMINMLETNHQEQKYFLDVVKKARMDIDEILPLSTDHEDPLLKDPIVDAANISLESGGKRLRPIMTWLMGSDEYGLQREALVPLLKSLEYMHTASLIFDDLPSQDNAPIRRGRPTLHEVYNHGIAELTGIFLIQKATNEQASLQGYPPEKVLKLIQYSSQTAADMCRGQALDLESEGKHLTIDELNTMCFYKTGIAFEASIIMPAILAGKNEAELRPLKKFAYHAGIAFQIKDDLLDIESDPDLLGKPVGIDQTNHRSTFVTVLGKEEAEKAMWAHYCSAMEALREAQVKTSFLKHFIDYLVFREL